MDDYPHFLKKKIDFSFCILLTNLYLCSRLYNKVYGISK